MYEGYERSDRPLHTGQFALPLAVRCPWRGAVHRDMYELYQSTVFSYREETPWGHEGTATKAELAILASNCGMITKPTKVVRRTRPD